MKHSGLLRRMTPAAVTLFTAVVIAGCAGKTLSQAPDLTAIPLSSLPSAQNDEALESGIPPVIWWKQLGDAQLANLVQLAWENNRDIRAAAARLTSAREQLYAAEGARLPNAQLNLSGSRVRLAEAESRSGTATVVNSAQWQGLLSWELDLFGRIRYGIDAAQASANEREALHGDIRRLILAQVVETYLDLRGAQMLRESLQAQLDNQAATLKLLRERENAGTALRADRLRFEAQFRLLGARLPSLLAQERAARNRLATLTGQALDATTLDFLDPSTPLVVPQSLVVDAPANLLRRRPDVRAAEQVLVGAVAHEGLAYSDQFPRISITALLGGMGAFGEWTGGDARRWSGGAAFSLPLFDGGARRARVRSASADIEAARAAFDKVVATALEETDTAVSSWLQNRKRLAELDRAYTLAQDSASLARTRFREGAESLLAVLEAERTALSAREQLITTRRDFAIATARSYVAMAGGLDIGSEHK